MYEDWTKVTQWETINQVTGTIAGKFKDKNISLHLSILIQKHSAFNINLSLYGTPHLPNVDNILNMMIL